MKIFFFVKKLPEKKVVFFFNFLNFLSSKNENFKLRIISTIYKCTEKIYDKFQVNLFNRTCEIVDTIFKKTVSRKRGIKVPL